jgi:hypothetical protein
MPPTLLGEAAADAERQIMTAPEPSPRSDCESAPEPHTVD